MPEFSIVIPVHNAAPYLRECLDSVACAAENVEKLKGCKVEKSGEGVEVICVDDGSTDGSGAILDEYASRFNLSTFQPFNFKVIHQKNAGVSAARNRGLEIATGEWVWFVDADDILRADALERFAAVDRKADVNFFGATFLYEDGTRRAHSAGFAELAESADEISVVARRLYRNDSGVNLLGFAWNKFFRAELIRANNLRFPVGLSVSEDEVFALSAVSHAKSVQVLSIDGYVYRKHKTGLTYRPNQDYGLLCDCFESIARDSGNGGLRKFALFRAARESRSMLLREPTTGNWFRYKRLMAFDDSRHVRFYAGLAKLPDRVAVLIVRIAVSCRRIAR